MSENGSEAYPSSTEGLTELKVYFVAPGHLVQKVKQALADRCLLDHSEKVRGKSNGLFQIPTKLPFSDGRGFEEQVHPTKEVIASSLGLCTATDAISYSVETEPSLIKKRSSKSHDKILAQVLRDWVHGLNPQLLENMKTSADDLVASCPKISAIYYPMLLLSKTSFTSDAWGRFICDDSASAMGCLFKSISRQFGISHIAKLGPILVEDGNIDVSSPKPNVLRSPTQFQPLYGNFGQYIPHPTNPNSLPETLWVTVKQNGIHQVWAPLYTMFSHGNITEKQRLLNMLLEEQKEIVPAESAAVDLYAGIGYFSFCYAKAGFDKVLCWELNPWSVEGLRRGALRNKRRFSLFPTSGDDESPEETDGSPGKGNESIIAFHENNIHAAQRIDVLRKDLPPVRHVNCGLLPTSEAVWKDALGILDPQLGGWIHVHENIDDGERDRRVNEITELFISEAAPRQIGQVNLHRVKSYAPGITHWVLDIAILPA